MNKYIVKNCPSINGYSYCVSKTTPDLTQCKDCTDCLIKQVVELHKEAERKCEQLTPSEFKQWFEEELIMDVFNKLFEIEEVKDDVINI